MTAPVTTGHLEAGLEAFFHRRVRLLGGVALKLAPTERGVPDRLVLFPGGLIFLVELKASGGKTSASQDVWHARAERLGTHVFVLTGRADVTAWLRQVADARARGLSMKVGKK